MSSLYSDKKNWHKNLKENIRNVDELKKYIKLSKYDEKILRQVVELHPLSISKYYLSLINKDDKNDPLRKLIVPSVEELDESGSYDPSDEKSNIKTVGLQHKYSQTALIISTNRCAAYCRFCFRKRLVGLPSHEILEQFNQGIKYIQQHQEINNVLVSGGYPLILPTALIEKFLINLTKIKHLDFIRFGSRVPVVFPERIYSDKNLLRVFKKFSQPKRRVYISTHFNHPREITKESIKAIEALIKAGVIINNQTVLLKGVNDNSEILGELMNSLVAIGVNPYYIFQCRPVKRVKRQFAVSLRDGYKIIEQAKCQMNGYSKRFKYVMSHKRGKIEIVAVKGDKVYFKFHQAKNLKDSGKFFERKLDKQACWLP